MGIVDSDSSKVKLSDYMIFRSWERPDIPALVKDLSIGSGDDSYTIPETGKAVPDCCNQANVKGTVVLQYADEVNR